VIAVHTFRSTKGPIAPGKGILPAVAGSSPPFVVLLGIAVEIEGEEIVQAQGVVPGVVQGRLPLARGFQPGVVQGYPQAPGFAPLDLQEDIALSRFIPRHNVHFRILGRHPLELFQALLQIPKVE